MRSHFCLTKVVKAFTTFVQSAIAFYFMLTPFGSAFFMHKFLAENFHGAIWPCLCGQLVPHFEIQTKKCMAKLIGYRP